MPLCLPVPLMREASWVGEGEVDFGSIKTHCGVRGVGHSPAVGTSKAWRLNKDCPMRLHGKDLDIAATTATDHTIPGKVAQGKKCFQKVRFY